MSILIWTSAMGRELNIHTEFLTSSCSDNQCNAYLPIFKASYLSKTIAILSKELTQQAELLRKRKKATKGKRVRLDGVHVYTTEEILRVAREEEAKAATKRPRGRPKKIVIIETSDEEEDQVSESSESEFYCSPVMRGRRAVASHVQI